ncbi:hypothetical protein VP1G_11151 [Cytospora mali]|uniref:Non-classical export protein 1 n=1 Tax=Cytospora mali TaxID=578113 RepID=A0A194V9Z3_CYTMA|nr:hypothetical protein VP1G_11151 [Valsa mali var. pyri (nom. inval.)]
MPAPTYIISKVADPIFAVFIGLSAAATRINREEKEKGRTTSETINAGLRHKNRAFQERILNLSMPRWKEAHTAV